MLNTDVLNLREHFKTQRPAPVILLVNQVDIRIAREWDYSEICVIDQQRLVERKFILSAIILKGLKRYVEDIRRNFLPVSCYKH